MKAQLKSKTSISEANGDWIPPLTVSYATPSAPRGWTWRLLRDVARLESGHTPSRYRPDWWGGDVPWLALPDIRQLDGRVVNETTEYTNEAGIANSSARILPAGTICLSRTASVGFVTKMGRPMATSQDFVNWVCGPDLDPDFLLHLLIASRDYIREQSSGAIHKTVYVPTVKEFRICCPPLAEQKRIAAILKEQLAAVEHARAAAQAQLEAAKALPAAYMREVFDNDDARAWPKRPLRELCATNGQYGTSDSACDDPNSGLPVLRMGNLVEGRIDWSDLRYAVLTPEETAKYQLRGGDLVFNRTNSAELVGKTAVFEGDQSAVFASYLIRFRIRRDISDPHFVAAFINSRYGRRFIEDNMSRAIGQVNISASTMHTMPIPCPPFEIQRRKSEVIRGCQEGTQSLRRSIEMRLKEINAMPASLLRAAFQGRL
ncbi:MAG: restriction endonuclease subunit S [Pirellulales bacterium]